VVSKISKKIQSDLNRLVEWHEVNALELNVGKCKLIMFSRLRHPIEFSYMLGGHILDRVDSINDLGVIMDSKVSFNEHIDVTVGRALAMLRFVKRLWFEVDVNVRFSSIRRQMHVDSSRDTGRKTC
jgi:hypothetical protein